MANIFHPLISVCCCTYNASARIKELLDSIYNQTYDNIEVVVVDGASNDGTLSIVKQYLREQDIVISEPDKGVYDAMNKALKVANGDFLIFMGADDHFISYNAVKKVVEAIGKDGAKENAIYYGNVYAEKDDSVWKKTQTNWDWVRGTMCHQCIFYPMSVYKKYSYDLKYRINADYAYNLNLVGSVDFRHIDVTVSYFSHGGISGSEDIDENWIKDKDELMRVKLGGGKIFLPEIKEDQPTIHKDANDAHVKENIAEIKNPCPKISIITICYNAEKEIEGTIKSVVNQTFKDYEYIIVDGGSKDGTMDIVRKYKDKIDIIVSEPDKGIYDAMNKGIKMAHGEWLNMMNGGDMFADNDVLTKIFSKEIPDGKTFLYSDCFIKKGNDIYFGGKKGSFKKGNLLHQAIIYKRALHDNYGYYIVSKRKLISDYLFFISVPEEQTMKIDVPICIFDKSGISSQGNWSGTQALCADVIYGRRTLANMITSYLLKRIKCSFPLSFRYRIKSLLGLTYAKK